jgi:hypothetical protein
MKRALFPMLLMALAGGVLPALAAAKAPVASALLSANEAALLVGGPLDEVSKSEVKPNAENGHDHTTICGYFPKGYQLETAERPPERGIQLSLHTFPSRAEAKKFFNFSKEAQQESAKSFPGGKFSPLKGAGEAGFVSTKVITPEPKADYQIALAYFVKGSTMAQLTVWKRSAPVAGIATTAAKQVAAKLP